MQDPTTIAPGELALVVLGLPKPGEKPRKVTIEQLEEMARLPKKIDQLARQAFASVIPYQAAKAPSYDEQLAHFNLPQDPAHVHDQVGRFPTEAHEIAVPYSALVAEADQYLRGIFPRSTYETFTGPRPLTPDDLRVWKFNGKLDVLGDPMKLFAMVSSGALLQSQVEPLEELLPTFLAYCKAALKDALTEKLTENPKYMVPPRVELSASVLTGRKVDVHGSPRPPPKEAPAPATEPSPADMSQAEKAAAV
jgi:hypothetical protein